MSIIERMTKTVPIKGVAMKPAAKKTAALVVKPDSVERLASGRTKPKLAAEELTIKPGATFKYRETSGFGVVMAAYIPSSCRSLQFAIAPSLERQMREATAGLNRTTAIVALADYACFQLKKTPGELVIHPEEARAGLGKRICTFTLTPGKRLSFNLTGPLPGWPNDKTRTRIAVPEDVRSHIEGFRSAGSFSGLILGLCQWSLDDLARRKKQLIITPAGEATPN
jgi:hypothetical protein